nr:uncharacterized protein LOC108176166 [Oryctolagus cuniculus]
MRPAAARADRRGPALGARSESPSGLAPPPHRVSEKTIRVVVFHRRPARPAPPPRPSRGREGAGASHLFYTSHVSSPCQTRVKLNRGRGGETGLGRARGARHGARARARSGPGRGRAPGRGGGGGASSSRGARPAPLRAPARPTQPLEPILIPKLRIRLADFPYLHCSNMPEAVHLGDLLRIWVRPGTRFTPSPPDFQGPARAHRTPPEPRRFPRHGPLSRGEPIPGRPAFTKKRELSRGSHGFSGIGRVTALDASRRPSLPLRIRGSEPDSLSIG